MSRVKLYLVRFSKIVPGTILLAIAMALALARGVSAGELPVLGNVPSFQLRSQNGKPFTKARLKNKIWIADFIYTRCSDECPLLSARMSKLQSKLKSVPNVLLVSFTVDPAYDTPSVLGAYASHFGADPNRWIFLTGDARVLRNVGEKAFHLPTVSTPTRSGLILGHSNFLSLVDGGGKIRGYYDSSRRELFNMLIHDATALGSVKK